SEQLRGAGGENDGEDGAGDARGEAAQEDEQRQRAGADAERRQVGRLDVPGIGFELADEVGGQAALDPEAEEVLELGGGDDDGDAGGEAGGDGVGDELDQGSQAGDAHEDDHDAGHEGGSGEAGVAVLIGDGVDDDDEG